MRKSVRRKHWNPAHNPVRCAVFVAKARALPNDFMPMDTQVLLSLREFADGLVRDDSLILFEALSAVSADLAARGIGLEIVPLCERTNACVRQLRRSREMNDQALQTFTEFWQWHQAQRDLAGPLEYARAAAPHCDMTA